ncbi:MAG: Hsp33 family molecular chaperone HslO [Acidobacteriota bacterium]
MEPQNDRLIQGMTGNGEFRIIAAQTTNTVETLRVRVDLSPLATDAIGRAMTGAILLARLLDKQLTEQRVTLRFEGNGPMGLLIAEGTSSGEARGFVANPQIAYEGLTVGDAVGVDGTLTVIRGTQPDGKPYTSQVELVSGEIAKDLAHFLLSSEQVTSAVLLGVLNRRQGVAAAGGMIVQAFPHASEASLETMETAIRNAPSFSSLLSTMPIDEAVETVLQDVGYRALDHRHDVPLRFRCSCSRDRAFAPLTLFSPAELREMSRNEGGSEVTCQYCGARYQFSAEELDMLAQPPDA